MLTILETLEKGNKIKGSRKTFLHVVNNRKNINDTSKALSYPIRTLRIVRTTAHHQWLRFPKNCSKKHSSTLKKKKHHY